ncbi:hypothetical protein TRFO_27337 [Tritrichomonas foetus]|uniref:Uncharacterized protein n=1 Tax=Tritrichomonas foetus TaxID=1144522 RepID=A0A1J4K0S2_9EUKA|nr:hypothetical protein TRFO_27337 [Tritrichomonas foetus]|eukprot:OHT05025.1 hypothetical protein TRFO_27337 [Tritrichomonas foetus]
MKSLNDEEKSSKLKEDDDDDDDDGSPISLSSLVAPSKPIHDRPNKDSSSKASRQETKTTTVTPDKKSRKERRLTDPPSKNNHQTSITPSESQAEGGNSKIDDGSQKVEGIPKLELATPKLDIKINDIKHSPRIVDSSKQQGKDTGDKKIRRLTEPPLKQSPRTSFTKEDPHKANESPVAHIKITAASLQEQKALIHQRRLTSSPNKSDSGEARVNFELQPSPQETTSAKAPVSHKMSEEQKEALKQLAIDRVQKKALSLIKTLKTKGEQEYQKVRSDAKKYKEISSKLKENQNKYKEKVKLIQADLNKKLTKLQITYLPEQIKLEELLFQQATEEKEAKKKSMQKSVHLSIEALQMINEEHIKFENNFRELMQKQSLKINSKKKKLNLLEAKLKNQYDASAEQEKILKEIEEKINSYEKELKEKLPVSQESASLRIKIASNQDIFDEFNRKLNIYSSDCKTSKDLLTKMSSYLQPVVFGTDLIYRLREKVKSFMNYSIEDVDRATLEDVLHICETTLLVLNSGNSNSNNYSEFNNFLAELQEFEQSLDNEVVKALDIGRINSLLQSVTPIPLNLAISPHLVRALAYRAKKDAAKDELKDFAKQIPRIFHPSQMLRNREDCEKFALSFRSELRKAKKGEQFSLMKFISPLQAILSNQSKEEMKPKLRLVAPQEIASKEAEAAAINEAESELPSLRRRVADLEALYDQFARYNAALSDLKQQLPQKIEDMQNEITVSEEILRDIEKDNKENTE